MTLLWPGFLVALGLLPLLLAAYLWALRRRRRFALRYSSLSLLREALPRHSWLRRHGPFGLFLVCVACLALALTRPVSVVSVPGAGVTILFVIDVSGSMCQTDIQPTRLQAAEAAALEFIRRQPPATRIGLVAFSGFAELVQVPTADSEALRLAIESLAVGRRTAIGSGLLEAIDAIAEVYPDDVVPSISETQPGIEPTPVPEGAYVPAIIVLLTDGVSNAGPLPTDAAQQAADRGIKVYAIGFGTETGSGSVRGCGTGFGGGFNSRGPGGGGGGGGGFRRGIDDVTLKEVAKMTGGSYYAAASSDELHSVFENLPTHLITKHETTEITFLFVLLGALAAALAIGLSLAWHPLP
jgi:Ca-activated chloride channel family protein